MSIELTGSLVAIVTPMREDGTIDLPALDRLVDWHVDAGTNGIVVVGTTGESATLSVQEHCDLVSHCVEVAGKRIPIIAGTGSNSTEEALYFTKSAAEHGADAALLVTPYYNKPSQEGLYQHFKAVADAIDIPQILYNVPGRTACDMSLETVNRLADLENIVGIKDATGDIMRGHELVKSCGDRLKVYSGEDAITLSLMEGGADGTISVTANVNPSLMAEMCGLALAGDFVAAAEIDSKLALLHQNLFLESNPIPVKWALAKMGLIEPGIRLPLVELDVKYHVEVTAALEQAGVSFPEAA